MSGVDSTLEQARPRTQSEDEDAEGKWNICGICLQTLGVDSVKRLPCFHFFCDKCLPRIFKSPKNQRNVNNPSYFGYGECPSCKTAFKPNDLIDGIGEMTILNTLNTPKSCECGGTATFHCDSCDNADFCTNCYKNHQKIARLKRTHISFPIRRVSNECKDCHSSDAEFYDKDQNEHYCRKCKKNKKIPSWIEYMSHVNRSYQSDVLIMRACRTSLLGEINSEMGNVQNKWKRDSQKCRAKIERCQQLIWFFTDLIKCTSTLKSSVKFSKFKEYKSISSNIIKESTSIFSPESSSSSVSSSDDEDNESSNDEDTEGEVEPLANDNRARLTSSERQIENPDEEMPNGRRPSVLRRSRRGTSTSQNMNAVAETPVARPNLASTSRKRKFGEKENGPRTKIVRTKQTAGKAAGRKPPAKKLAAKHIPPGPGTVARRHQKNTELKSLVARDILERKHFEMLKAGTMIAHFQQYSDEDGEGCCAICHDGGELILCDEENCQKVFEKECHFPLLKGREPPDNWQCFFCISVRMLKRPTYLAKALQIYNIPKKSLKGNLSAYLVACKFINELYAIYECLIVRVKLTDAYKAKFGIAKLPVTLHDIRDRLVKPSRASYYESFEDILRDLRKMMQQASLLYSNTKSKEYAIFNNFKASLNLKQMEYKAYF